MKTMKTPHCYSSTTKEWRAWFRKHHRNEKKVNLIVYKKYTGKPFLTHRQAMEEAICWGWIDTTIKRLDDEKFQRSFVKRKPNATWSTNTLRYAEEMITKKRMTKAGLTAYERGKSKPTIDHNLPKNPDIPDNLKKALAKEQLLPKFMNYPPSLKRMFIWQILVAKRPETIQKRIKMTVEKVRKGEKQ
jgi:uncharacterized protein YdeI (YjbR/CyaY-like superfamily)